MFSDFDCTIGNDYRINNLSFIDFLEETILSVLIYATFLCVCHLYVNDIAFICFLASDAGFKSCHSWSFYCKQYVRIHRQAAHESACSVGGIVKLLSLKKSTLNLSYT